MFPARKHYSTNHDPLAMDPEADCRRRAARYPVTAGKILVGWAASPPLHDLQSRDAHDGWDAADHDLTPRALELYREAKAAAAAAAVTIRWEFGLVLDISSVGASVAVDTLPAAGSSCWLRLPEEAEDRAFAANVRSVTSTPRGPHVIRVEFEESSPYDFFVSIAYRRNWV